MDRENIVIIISFACALYFAFKIERLLCFASFNR